MYANATKTLVDASAGNVTDQAVSGGDPAVLYGWYAIAGVADTLTVKDGATAVFTETVGAGDASADIGAVPAGVGVRFDSLVVSLTTVAQVYVYWQPA